MFANSRNRFTLRRIAETMLLAFENSLWARRNQTRRIAKPIHEIWIEYNTVRCNVSLVPSRWYEVTNRWMGTSIHLKLVLFHYKLTIVILQVMQHDLLYCWIRISSRRCWMSWSKLMIVDNITIRHYTSTIRFMLFWCTWAIAVQPPVAV